MDIMSMLRPKWGRYPFNAQTLHALCSTHQQSKGLEGAPLAMLRRNIKKGLSYGDHTFIGKLEKLTHRALRFRPQYSPPEKG
jgi:hypothetical protein